MAACLRRFCWRPRIATVWSLCPTFKVTSLILMCQGYKPEALMCSPCIRKIPKAKVKQSPCTLLQSRKRKSIQLDQHTVRIQGKKLILDLYVILICRGYKGEALMCSPCIRKIPKAKVKQSPCTLLQSRKRKSIQLDQHTVRIQGK